MKKLLSCLMALTILSGCASSKDVQKIKTNVDYFYVAEGEKYSNLTVTTSPDEEGEVEYKIKNKKIAKVNESGVVTGVSQGKTQLIITSKDNEKATKTVDVQVYLFKKLDKNPYSVQWKWTEAYDGNAYVAAQTGKSEEEIKNTILKDSFSYLGAGYSQAVRYGPTYDCSSYIETLYKKHYNVSTGYFTGAMRTTLKNYKKDINDKKIGDIIFGTNGSANHVAIYLGNNRMIHCGDSVGGVSVTSIYYGPFAPVTK